MTTAAARHAPSDTCVFAELCWTPSALEQAEARVHRMGQQSSSTTIYYLTAGGKDSPDAIMFNALSNCSGAHVPGAGFGKLEADHADYLYTSALYFVILNCAAT